MTEAPRTPPDPLAEPLSVEEQQELDTLLEAILLPGFTVRERQIASATAKLMLGQVRTLTARNERLEQQAHDIEELLRDAGVGACLLPEGVRLLREQRDKWLTAFNESEQFQDGPTKRAEVAEARAERLAAALQASQDDLSKANETIWQLEEELKRWQTCENCGERLHGPGICDKAITEHEKGLELMLEETLTRAEQAEAALQAAQDARRAERETLRNALIGLVGASSREELEQLEAAMRLMPAPAADKAASIDAIHALLATEAAPLPEPGA